MSSKRERAVVGTPVVIDPATQTQEFQSGKFSPGSADGKRGSGEVVVTSRIARGVVVRES